MEKKTSFEDGMKRLEKIIARLESGDVSLEESLKLSEEGVSLVRAARKQLEAAEQKVTLLEKDGEGRVVGEEPFEPAKEPEN